jgi:LacI family transcriptional regulator
LTKKKTTINDIANYAKVSAGTVDRVINNRGKVSPDKRKAIEKAIKHLDYNPNFLASALALRKLYEICVLIPEAKTSHNYWSLPKKGIEKMSKEYEDFGLVIDFCEYSLFDESSFIEQSEVILQKEPAGVILAPLFENESNAFVDRLEEQDIPYVFIDANIANRMALSYIGPNLMSTGRVVGRLLSSILGAEDDILIVNMVKAFENSSHVGVIEEGFLDFFNSCKNKEKRTISSLTMQSTNKMDVNKELTKYYINNPHIKGVFVTNSRVHLISDFHRKHELDIKLVGFNLIDDNISEMKRGGIDFLISQRPFFQGVSAIQYFFDFFIYKKEPKRVYYVPIDIIIKENVEFYINPH